MGKRELRPLCQNDYDKILVEHLGKPVSVHNSATRETINGILIQKPGYDPLFPIQFHPSGFFAVAYEEDVQGARSERKRRGKTKLEETSATDTLYFAINSANITSAPHLIEEEDLLDVRINRPINNIHMTRSDGYVPRNDRKVFNWYLARQEHQKEDLLSFPDSAAEKYFKRNIGGKIWGFASQSVPGLEALIAEYPYANSGFFFFKDFLPIIRSIPVSLPISTRQEQVQSYELKSVDWILLAIGEDHSMYRQDKDMSDQALSYVLSPLTEADILTYTEARIFRDWMLNGNHSKRAPAGKPSKDFSLEGKDYKLFSKYSQNFRVLGIDYHVPEEEQHAANDIYHCLITHKLGSCGAEDGGGVEKGVKFTTKGLCEMGGCWMHENYAEEGRHIATPEPEVQAH